MAVPCPYYKLRVDYKLCVERKVSVETRNQQIHLPLISSTVRVHYYVDNTQPRSFQGERD